MALTQEEIKLLNASIDQALSKADLSEVTAERATSFDLPDGYFLVELTEGELTLSKSSKKPQAVIKFKCVEDGFKEETDEDGNVSLVPAQNTKGRTFTKYYPITVENNNIQKFASDMIKFEGEDGPFYSKDDFKSAEFLAAMLESLVNARVYVKVSRSQKNDTEVSIWYNLISNARAKQLELPM